MMKTKFLLILYICFLNEICLASMVISPQEKWGNVFSGEHISFQFSVRSDTLFDGIIGWQFSSGGRTIHRGENTLHVNTFEPEPVTVYLQIPICREGVVLKSLLSLSVYDSQSKKEITNFEKDIWIFPKKPFQDKQQWLDKLKISLFDPIEKTSDVLRNAKIPFKQIFNKDALLDIKGGIVLIGEGLKLSNHRGLPGIMSELSDSGVTVICLAPAEGMISIPNKKDSTGAGPISMSLMRNKIIKKMDKRFDDSQWPPDGQIVFSSMQLKEINNAIAAKINKDSQGWFWMEIEAAEPNGRLIVCGLNLIEKWDSGPVPRYFFLQLLEYISGKSYGNTDVDN